MEYDYFSSFKLPLFFLKKLGMWQQRDAHWKYRVYGAVLHFMTVELFAIFHTGYMIDMLVKGSILRFSDALTILFTFYSLIIKSCWFTMKIKNFQKLIQTLKDLLELSSFGRVGKRRPKLEAKIVKVTRVSNSFYVLGYFMCTSAALMPILSNKKGLSYETSFLWDHRKSDTAFYSLAIYEYFISLYGTFVSSSLDMFLVVIMEFASAIIDEISLEIDSIDGDDEKALKNLEKCMECHIKTKLFVKDISENVSFFFFLQSFMSTVILCTSSFLLTSVRLK